MANDPATEKTGIDRRPLLERLGPYVLLEQVAQGGMAEVFRAAAVGAAGFAKMLAIKRVLPIYAQDPRFNAMFVDEARLAAQLGHPNILQVLDLGSTKGALYIVMEYVAGASLARIEQVCRRTGQHMPPEMGCQVVLEALAGLAYAHGKKDARGQLLGIIHRDVTPHNIMVSFDGMVKLADFGIAKAASRTADATVSGSVKGKPRYLAPEQLDARLGEPDQRLDLYATAVVLYELLAHRRMRDSPDEMRVLGAAMTGAYSTFDKCGVDVPGALARVVYRALEPRPEDRFQTADELHDALSEAVQALRWRWTSAQTAQWLCQLLPSDVAREQEAGRTFGALVTELAARGQDDDSVGALLDERRSSLQPWGAVVNGQDRTADLPVATAAAPRSRKPVALGAVGALLLAAVGFWWMREAPAPQEVVTRPAGAQLAVEHPERVEVPTVPTDATVPANVPERVVARAEAHGMGTVTIQSIPWARVFLDGKDTGLFTPVVDLPISAGVHKIRMVNASDQVSATVRVTVRPGQRQTVTRTLR